MVTQKVAKEFIDYTKQQPSKMDSAKKAYTINGAGGRNRTDMDLHPLDFESSASTSFTTPAHMK